MYHTPQDPSSAPSPETLAAIRTSTAELQSATSTLQSEIRELKSQLASLTAHKTTAQMREEIEKLECEKSGLLERLDALRAGGVQLVSFDERKRVAGLVDRWSAVCRRRREVWKDVWAVVVDMAAGMEGVDLEELKVCYQC